MKDLKRKKKKKIGLNRGPPTPPPHTITYLI